MQCIVKEGVANKYMLRIHIHKPLLGSKEFLDIVTAAADRGAKHATLGELGTATQKDWLGRTVRLSVGLVVGWWVMGLITHQGISLLVD